MNPEIFIQFCRQPIEALVQALACQCATPLQLPRPATYRQNTNFLCDLLNGVFALINFVGKYEQGNIFKSLSFHELVNGAINFFVPVIV